MQEAIEEGDAMELAELIRQDPGLDVNVDYDGEWHTLLHLACLGYDRSPVIPLLLAHPDIDVNVKDLDGWTPYYAACFHGYTSCVREMLRDSRVKLNERDNLGYTPLWVSTSNGGFDIIQWWIASGREMDLGTPGDVDRTDAIGGAMKYKKMDVVTLLKRFQEHPEETRRTVRLEIGWCDEVAAEMFALVVFVSDELLHVNETAPAPAARFFNIARRLPLELQMVLCHLVVGSAKEIIPGNDSEVAFKSLANRLGWSSFFTS